MARRSNGGRGINLASIAGIIANRGIGGQGYEMAKAAVIAVTRAPAADWAHHGVTVNAIAPGGFRTDPNLRGQSIHPSIIETLKAPVPMSEYGEPEGRAPRAVYPASDASRHMTGAVLVIDGGDTLG
jgi:gluconate 5-dehydrogenase